jgi:hypothetical protein
VQQQLTPGWATAPDSLVAAHLHGDRAVRPHLWLGTHMPEWLARPELSHVSWFVSRRRLERRVTLPVARTSWAMDSGAFTEASQYGRWTLGVDDYIAFARRAANEMGNLAWVAPMDLCCEPAVVAKVASTGWLDSVVRSRIGMPADPVFKHLVWTVRNFLELRDRLSRPGDPHVIPVVQGWTLDHYAWCLELYEMAGVDLPAEVLVGIGSTCRRDAELAIAAKVALLGEAGIDRVHAFGIKGDAVWLTHHRIASFDSLAWSFRARMHGTPFHEGAAHAHCGNCPVGALTWRDRLLARTDTMVHAWRESSRWLWSEVQAGRWPVPVDDQG